MLEVSPALFYTAAILAIACALNVVFNRNPIASAFSLILVFFSFAAIYADIGAHLVAALQILVYAGAVMVLFVFVIMLLNADTRAAKLGSNSQIVNFLAGGLGLALMGIFIFALKSEPFSGVKGPFTSEAVEAAGGNTQVLAEIMFSDYILPFEVTSLLLLGAIVGTVAIAMRKKGKVS